MSDSENPTYMVPLTEEELRFLLTCLDSYQKWELIPVIRGTTALSGVTGNDEPLPPDIDQQMILHARLNERFGTFGR